MLQCILHNFYIYYFEGFIMPYPKTCTFNKEFLATTTILYIEDEDKIRDEISQMFYVLFKEVFIADNGEDGFEIYKQNRDKIDIILTDINMPKLSGLELLAEIRKIDWDMPILITTGFTDSEILLKAIKYNVTNYILKPMQFNTTFKIIANIMEEKEREKRLKVQDNELKQFMSILEAQNLICEFDANGQILYVNDLYITASGYSLDELLSMKHEQLNDSSISLHKYQEMLEMIHVGQTKSCECKKITKTGMKYFTHSTFLPIVSINTDIKKYIEFGTLTTKYEKEILNLKKNILSLKSEYFKTNLDNKSQQVEIEKMTIKFQQQIDDSINGSQQLIFEIQELKKHNKELQEKLLEQEKRFEEFQVQAWKQSLG